MNVLVIPEDFRRDQYILKPLFEKLFRSLVGRRRANVAICQKPLLGGIGEALKVERLKGIVEQYRGKADIFILCVDRDGVTDRRRQLDRIEREAGGDAVLFAENAWEEIETWALAGLDLPRGWRWREVRDEVNVKERYFQPLAQQRRVAGTLGGGRKVLGEEAARRLDAIRQKCPEDFDRLAQRVEAAAQA